MNKPETVQVIWTIIGNPPGKHFPAWMRLAGYVPDWDSVYVPAALSGNEMTTMFCCLSEGTPMLHQKGHVYVSTTWMAENNPKTKTACANFEKDVRNFMKTYKEAA